MNSPLLSLLILTGQVLKVKPRTPPHLTQNWDGLSVSLREQL